MSSKPSYGLKDMINRKQGNRLPYGHPNVIQVVIKNNCNYNLMYKT